MAGHAGWRQALAGAAQMKKWPPMAAIVARRALLI
jgi:hypothetical protein